MRTKIRSYTELSQLGTLEERFNYLALHSRIGDSTFGFERYVNQKFYRSAQWQSVRNEVIVRDAACDLGVEGYDIRSRLYIHHMNPMTLRSIQEGDDDILSPEFLIATTHQTHNAIHYGDESLLPVPMVVRRPGDTKLW